MSTNPEPETADNRISFRVPSELLPELDARASYAEPANAARTAVIRGILQDYFHLLQQTRRDLRRRALLSANECAVILDAVNGCAHTAGMLGELAANVEDAIQMEGLTGTADLPVDFEALVSKLQGLTPIEEIAILDATVRWWNRSSRGEPVEYAELLHETRPA